MTLTLDQSLTAERGNFDQIPVIDIAALSGAGDIQSVAKAFRQALTTSGFMYVKNHGVPAELVDATYAASRRFFDQPLEAKMALHISQSDMALRGYTEIFGENADPKNTKDLKEIFDLGPEKPAGTGPFMGPNQWPEVEGFRNTLETYQAHMLRLARDMLRGIALSLDLAEDYFADKVDDPICILRMLHYPSQAGHIDPKMIGIGAHTDYGALTILSQDSVGGLQVMNRDKAWVEAPPMEGTFVINIGDMLQRLTNRVYIANLHRVINTSGAERYSIPFFFDGNPDATFAPLPSCISDDNPAHYEPVQVGPHMVHRYRASFPHLAEAS